MRFDPAWWAVLIVPAGVLLRAVIRALLPPGYYFRFMDRWIRRHNGDDDD